MFSTLDGYRAAYKSSKNWEWEYSLMVEHVLNMVKALGSMPDRKKPEKKKKRKRMIKK